jgi:hypothetical protein
VIAGKTDGCRLDRRLAIYRQAPSVFQRDEITVCPALS